MGLMQAIQTQHPGIHRAICQSVVETLNEALEADRKAINLFFRQEVLVNTDELRDHPTIQVGTRSMLHPEAVHLGSDDIVMRPLGLINGLLGVDEKNIGFIYVQTKAGGMLDDWIDFFFVRADHAGGGPALIGQLTYPDELPPGRRPILLVKPTPVEDTQE